MSRRSTIVSEQENLSNYVECVVAVELYLSLAVMVIVTSMRLLALYINCGKAILTVYRPRKNGEDCSMSILLLAISGLCARSRLRLIVNGELAGI